MPIPVLAGAALLSLGCGVIFSVCEYTYNSLLSKPTNNDDKSSALANLSNELVATKSINIPSLVSKDTPIKALLRIHDLNGLLSRFLQPEEAINLARTARWVYDLSFSDLGEAIRLLTLFNNKDFSFSAYYPTYIPTQYLALRRVTNLRPIPRCDIGIAPIDPKKLSVKEIKAFDKDTLVLFKNSSKENALYYIDTFKGVVAQVKIKGKEELIKQLNFSTTYEHANGNEIDLIRKITNRTLIRKNSIPLWNIVNPREPWSQFQEFFLIPRIIPTKWQATKDSFIASISIRDITRRILFGMSSLISIYKCVSIMEAFNKKYPSTYGCIKRWVSDGDGGGYYTDLCPLSDEAMREYAEVEEKYLTIALLALINGVLDALLCEQGNSTKILRLLIIFCLAEDKISQIPRLLASFLPSYDPNIRRVSKLSNNTIASFYSFFKDREDRIIKEQGLREIHSI